MKPLLWNLIGAFCFLLMVHIPPYVYPAVITLTSGQKIQGTIIKKTKKRIEVTVDGENVSYSRKKIAYIRGNPPRSFSNIDFSSKEDIPRYFKKALAVAGRGKFLQAEMLFKQILIFNPSHTNARQALTICDDVRKGIISCKYGKYLFQGAYQLLTEQYETAVKTFKKVLALNPQSPEVYYNLATAYQSLGHFKKAIPYLKKLVSHNPSDRDILFKLAMSYYSLNQYGEAIQYLKIATTLTPRDAESYSFLGLSYYALGKKRIGKRYLLKAKKLFLENGDQQRGEAIRQVLEKFL